MRLVTNAASQSLPRLMSDLDAMNLHFDRSEIFPRAISSRRKAIRFTSRNVSTSDTIRAGEYLAASGITVRDDPADNAVAISAVPIRMPHSTAPWAFWKRPHASSSCSIPTPGPRG